MLNNFIGFLPVYYLQLGSSTYMTAVALALVQLAGRLVSSPSNVWHIVHGRRAHSRNTKDTAAVFIALA